MIYPLVIDVTIEPDGTAAIPAASSRACSRSEFLSSVRTRAPRARNLAAHSRISIALVRARGAVRVVAVGDGKQSLGSGFAVAADLVVTAAHVARPSAHSLSSRRRPAASRHASWRRSRTTMFALLEIGQPLPALSLAAALPKVGEWICRGGKSVRRRDDRDGGIVSAAPGAISATPQLARRIQINASVNPGNSGAPW
jgi:S1-C subfamily serine protease